MRALPRFRAEHPVAATLSELAGGLAVPGLGTAGTITRTGGRVGGGLLRQAGRSALAGAGAGALAGAGEARSLAELPGTAGRGAAAGGVVGGLTGTVSNLASSVAAGRSGQAGGEALVREVAGTGDVTEEAARLTREGIERIRPGQAVPADVDPESFGRILRAVRNDASGNTRKVLETVEARPVGAGERLAQDVRDITGVTEAGVGRARQLAQQKQRDLGRKLFGAFDDTPVVDEEFTALLQNPDVRAVWQRVRPRAGRDDDPVFQHVQNLRQRLRGNADQAQRAGNTAEAVALREAADQVDLILERQVPGFRAANELFAQGQRVVDAFDAGLDAFNRKLGAREITAELGDLTRRAGPRADEVVNAYRQGMVDQWLRNLLRTTEGRNPQRAFVGGRGALGKERLDAIRFMFENEADMNEFIQRAVAENRFASVASSVVSNSTTAMQQQDLSRFGFNVDRNFLMRILLRPDPQAAKEKADAITNLLLTPGDEAFERFIRAVSRGLPPNAPAAIGLGVGVGTAPATTGLISEVDRRN